MLSMLGPAMWAPSREAVPLSFRTSGSRLQMLLEREKRPLTSSSASKENCRKCCVHFVLFSGSLLSDTAVPLRFPLLTRQKNKTIPVIIATTMGTATAAWRADENDKILHDDFSENAMAVVVLPAVLVAVPGEGLLKLMLADSEAPMTRR